MDAVCFAVENSATVPLALGSILSSWHAWECHLAAPAAILVTQVTVACALT